MKGPDLFNPETNLLSSKRGDKVFHESRGGAGLARRLFASGTPEDLELGHKVIEATLACQEMREDDPHYGNFHWMAEDDWVEDLNAVEFCLEHLIPLCLEHGDLVESGLYKRLLASIRLGLLEVVRLDVHVGYSNIALFDIVNSCLGGELLDDAAIARRGQKKLAAFAVHTDRVGIIQEYNSPTYTPIVIHCLHRLARLSTHEHSRVLARALCARLALSAAAHMSKATGRWAAPHSRAYQGTVVCEVPAEVLQVRGWVDSQVVPDWIGDILDTSADAYEVRETGEKAALTTYMSRSFDLGVSSTGRPGQANSMMAHYVRPGSERPGVMYTRYLTNDKWFGDFYHATDRIMSGNLLDEGRFFGVQQRSRAIGLLSPFRLGNVESAKGAFIFTDRDGCDEIWIDDTRVETLPAAVGPDSVVVIGSGDALFALRPLGRTDLGIGAPIHLVERGGDLVFEIYNYAGARKGFWELRNPGFFKGQPRCGVYLEVAERRDHEDGRAFGKLVASGVLKDVAEAPFVSDGDDERLWSVEYERDGERVGLEVDLMSWALKRRWTKEGDLGFPMHESPFAAQGQGRAQSGGASAEVSGGAVWLYADPSPGRFVAGYHGPETTDLRLEVPGGVVEVTLAAGMVTWDGGKVRVDATGQIGAPHVVGGELG